VSPVEKRYYNAKSLRAALDSFEERFGMDSEVFLRAHHADDERVREIPRFLRHSWASFYREWRELSDADFAASVKRELELA
jgi:hypothetical protein